jgi:hypothetical protein
MPLTVDIDVEDVPLRMAVSEADTQAYRIFTKSNAAPWPRCFMASNVMIKSIIRNLVL